MKQVQITNGEYASLLLALSVAITKFGEATDTARKQVEEFRRVRDKLKHAGT